MRFFIRALLLGVFALATAAAPNAASVQSAFPTRPITLVVPAAAGGPTDTVARLIAESMSRTLWSKLASELMKFSVRPPKGETRSAKNPIPETIDKGLLPITGAEDRGAIGDAL